MIVAEASALISPNGFAAANAAPAGREMEHAAGPPRLAEARPLRGLTLTRPLAAGPGARRGEGGGHPALLGPPPRAGPGQALRWDIWAGLGFPARWRHGEGPRLLPGWR